MIENYLKTHITKKKVIGFCVLFVICFAIVISQPVYSDFDFGQIAEFVVNPVGFAMSNITDEIFESVNVGLANIINSVWQFIMGAVIQPFSPNVDFFNEMTANAAKQIMPSITVSGTDMINNMSIFLGMFFSTFIFGFSIILYFLNGKVAEIKDNPISLVAKYGICIAIAFKSYDICTTLLSLFDDLWTSAVLNANVLDLQNIDGGLVGLFFKNGDSNIIFLGIPLPIGTLLAPLTTTIMFIITLVMFFKLCKGLFKLYLELVQRYITTIIVLFFFTLFASTIVSNNTSQIFKSYLKTLFSSIVLLFFDAVWFKLCFSIFTADMLSGSFMGSQSTSTIVHFIFFHCLVKAGLALDMLFKSMGMNVAAGAGKIGQSMGNAGRNLANALRAGKQIRENIGGILKAAAPAVGGAKGAGMFKVGDALSSPGSAINGSAKDPVRMCADFFKNGSKTPDNMLNGHDAANIMTKALKEPNNAIFQDALKSLSGDKLAEGLDAMGIKGATDAKLSSYIGEDGQRRLGIKFTDSEGVTAMAGGGILNGQALDSSGGLKVKYGNQMKPSESLNGNGRPLSVQAVEKKFGSDFAAAYAGINTHDANDRGYSIGKVEKYGRDTYRLFGTDGQIAGVYKDGIYSASGERASREVKDANFSNIKEGILQAGGYDEISEPDAQSGQPGHYKFTATKYNDDGTIGYAKDFSVSDRGTDLSSRNNGDIESFTYWGQDDYGNSIGYDVNAGKEYIPETPDVPEPYIEETVEDSLWGSFYGSVGSSEVETGSISNYGSHNGSNSISLADDGSYHMASYYGEDKVSSSVFIDSEDSDLISDYERKGFSQVDGEDPFDASDGNHYVRLTKMARKKKK